jgi:hypothetical protein
MRPNARLSVFRINAGAQIIPALCNASLISPDDCDLPSGLLAGLSEAVEEGEKAIAGLVAADCRFAGGGSGQRCLLHLHVSV